MRFMSMFPIGPLRRLIVGLRPNGQSLFLEALGGWIHKKMARKTSEPGPSVYDGESEDTIIPEPLGQSESYDPATAGQESWQPAVQVDGTDAGQIEGTDGRIEVPVGDAAAVRSDSGPRNEGELEPSKTESVDVILTLGTEIGPVSQGGVNHSNDLEVIPDVDPARRRDGGPDRILTKTMVESFPSNLFGSEDEGSDSLPAGLADIFVKKQYVNPRVKALLRGLDPIDCRELAEELHDFAQDIGATRSRKSQPV